MQHRSHSFLLLLLCFVLIAGNAMAAPRGKSSKHKKLTRTYTKASLIDVLTDICKRTDYKLDCSDAELDETMPVTRKFKDVSATSAIKRILGKQYIVKAKRGTIYITNVPVPPTTYQVRGVQPSDIAEDEDKIVYTYQDTTYAVACRTVTKRIDLEITEQQDLPAKHYVQALIGLGYGSLGHDLKDKDGNKAGTNRGDLQGQLQVQYAYYFHPNWGVTMGVGFSAFGSHSVLNNTTVWTDITDSDGEKYDHYALTHNWCEQQITHIVDFPIGIQCQYPLNDNNLRLYAGAGIRIGVPVYSRWALHKGALEHQGYYPQWNMLIREGEGNMTGDRDFYTEHIDSDWNTERHELKQKPVSLAVDANIGVMIPLNRQVDLMCGMYFQMGCLDLNPVKQTDRQEIGWQQTGKTPDCRNHTFMNQYAGLLNTGLASATHPWGVGVTVGVSWHRIEKPKKTEPTFEKLQVCDTTYTLAARTETTLKPKKEAAKQIVQVMRKSVIWFDVNSTEPKLEPADVLDKIAAVLIQNPDQQIVISGHASKEGNARKNRILSEQRAKVVAKMLEEKGVKENQLHVEAHSSDIAYITTDGTKHTIALDRRVEIIPLENGQPVQELQLTQTVEATE